MEEIYSSQDLEEALHGEGESGLGQYYIYYPANLETSKVSEAVREGSDGPEKDKQPGQSTQTPPPTLISSIIILRR